jgi:hypothetical protein
MNHIRLRNRNHPFVAGGLRSVAAALYEASILHHSAEGTGDQGIQFPPTIPGKDRPVPMYRAT